MSKNITIAEGAQAKNFNSVAKIRTNLIGGGTQNWIPEDEAGRYANLGELSVDENGTYRASDERLDGFSKITVNVPTESGGGGGGGSRLITKTITSNGTYNARSDGADGYSSVTVNVAFPHNKVVIGDVSNIPVANRISASDFLHDLNNATFNVVAPHVGSHLASVQHQLLDEAWLSDIPGIYNCNNAIMFGAGGYDSQDDGVGVCVWIWLMGIADESAEVSISEPDPNHCKLLLSSGNKFYYSPTYSRITLHYTRSIWTDLDDYQEMTEPIDNHQLLSNSSDSYQKDVARYGLKPIVGGYNTGLMTNLRW